MSDVKNCESCGMPMRAPEDFGGNDTSNKYCRYCTNEQGILKNYEDTLNGMTNFVVQTQGLDRSQAEKAAKEHMAKMPAWKNK
jgi:hypothetical protein